MRSKIKSCFGKKLFLIFLGLLFYQPAAFAQFEYFNSKQIQKIPSEVLKESVNIDIDSLMLDSILTQYMTSQSLPGIASVIVKDNEIIWNKNYGYRNIELQLPVEDSTLFLMGSISKTILATAVMQLWENGLIELEDNINDYLPAGFTVINPYYPNDTITVKMLMTHTSGLQDNWDILGNLWTCGDYQESLDSFLINYFTPGGTYYTLNNFYNYHPGKYYNYSNAGSCLLALMVENLSGKSFDKYTQDSIFTPLSMNCTSWFLAGLNTNKIAVPYMFNPSVPTCHTGFPYWPIGQLRTNKLELANFLMAYINGGILNNNRILESSTIEMMLTDQLDFPNQYGGKEGLIWYTDPNVYNNNNIWGHTGGWFGTSNDMWCSPAEKWGILYFVNWATINFDQWIFIWPDYIPRQMFDYAHLYGNIYARKYIIDKLYARNSIDSILFQTEFSNIYSHNFTSHLVYSNIAGTEKDSIILHDDGLNGDLLPNDEIYSGFVLPQEDEDYYSLSVSTVDSQSGKFFCIPDVCRFTTAGPAKLDSMEITFLPANNYYTMKASIRNLGTTASITSASVKLISNDPWVTSIIPESRGIPDIPAGSSVLSGSFSVRYDGSSFPGYFNFKVEVLNDGWTYWTDSTEVIVTGVEKKAKQPLTFNLEQNYPNPFNPSTILRYSIPKQSKVILKIYDILGNELETLVNEEKSAGTHDIKWNAENLSSGVYFYRLHAGNLSNTKTDFSAVKKLLLLK